MRDLVLAAVLLCAVPLASTAQSTRHPFAFDDAKIIHSARAVAVSPDGKNVLYRVHVWWRHGPGQYGMGLDSRRPEARPATSLFRRTLGPLGFTRDGSALWHIRSE